MPDTSLIPQISFRSFSGWKAFFKQLGKGFSGHDLMTMAAALAFYTALSLAPLLLITLAVVGIMGESSRDQLLMQIEGLMGSQASSAITAIVENADNKPKLGSFAGIIGVLTLIFSASGVFAQLQVSLNKIFNTQNESKAGLWGWIRKRLLSMGMVITLGFLALVSLVASTVISYLFGGEGVLWTVVNILVSLAVFSGVFALILKYLPDAHLPWRSAFTGGIITAVLFTIGKSLIGAYLGKSAVGSAYGAAGSLIVLLAWVYYSGIIVFTAAEITRILAAKQGAPDALAAEPETKAEAQERKQTHLRPSYT